MSDRVLLDSSTLIALALDPHEHHPRVARWLGSADFAVCPVTEGALVRSAVRTPGTSATDALTFLDSVTRSRRCEFWPDDVSYRDVRLAGVVGHKQVTDAYLAQLARNRRCRLATLDHGLARMHPDVADLVPTS